MKDNYDKLVYRVNTYKGNKTQFKHECVFFTDSLDYYDQSDTGYNKKDAQKYYLNLKDFKVFDPVKEWEDSIDIESWSVIRTSEEFANEKDLYITDYLDEVDYDNPDEYHEVLIDTDSLAEYGRDNDYDVTIIRDVPQLRSNKTFNEYVVHNSDCIKSDNIVEDANLEQETKLSRRAPIYLYRGTNERSFSKNHKPVSGLFFGVKKEYVTGWGNVKRYTLDKNAKIYEGHSSDAYCNETNLYNKDFSQFKEYFGMYTHFTRLQQFVDISEKDKDEIETEVKKYAGTQFCWMDVWTWCLQLVAKLDLESKGYDGAKWFHEDFGNPIQYQIWNLNVVKSKDGVVESLDKTNIDKGTNNLESKIIAKLKSMGYTIKLFTQGWYDDERGEPVNWEDDREEPENDWFYVEEDYYQCKNDANQVSFSWDIDESSKIFKIIGLYGKFKNSTKGFATKTIDETLELIPKDYVVEIKNSINNSYWDYIQDKYPQYNWNYVNESLNGNNINEDINFNYDWRGWITSTGKVISTYNGPHYDNIYNNKEKENDIRYNFGYERYIGLPETKPTNKQLEVLTKLFDSYFINGSNVGIRSTDMELQFGLSSKKDYKFIRVSPADYTTDEVIELIKRTYTSLSNNESLRESNNIFKIPTSNSVINQARKDLEKQGYTLKTLSIERLVKDNDLLNNDIYNHEELWGNNPDDYIFGDREIRDWKYSDIMSCTYKNGKYVLDNGRHRVRALYNDGYKYIEILIHNENTNEQLLLKKIRTKSINKSKQGLNKSDLKEPKCLISNVPNMDKEINELYNQLKHSK